MTRCPDCEAIVETDECYDCLVLHGRKETKDGMPYERPEKSHCRQGHAMTPDNTYERTRKDDRGNRVTRGCKACRTERDSRRVRAA